MSACSPLAEEEPHDLQSRIEQEQRVEDLPPHLLRGFGKFCAAHRATEASALERGRRGRHSGCAGLYPGRFAVFDVLLGLGAGSRHDCEELGRPALGQARRIYHDGFGWSRACDWESGRVRDGRDLVIQQLQLLSQGASTAILAAKGPERLLRQHRARHCT